jgi:carbonic anhydrase
MTFPWIAEKVAARRLELIGFLFDIHTGQLARVTPEAVEPID